MHHIVNLLVGVGSVLGALGTGPTYHFPTPADRSKDLRHIRGDVRAAGTSLKKATKKAELKYGTVHNRST